MDNKKAEVMESISSFSRKRQIDRNLLQGLIDRYNVDPDAVNGKVRFYRPQKLQELIAKVDEAMRN